MATSAGTEREQHAASGEISASPWSPFRHQAFTVLWIAAVVANIGTWMYNAGSGWLMTSLSGLDRRYSGSKLSCGRTTWTSYGEEMGRNVLIGEDETCISRSARADKARRLKYFDRRGNGGMLP